MREAKTLCSKCKHMFYFYYINGKTCVHMFNNDCHFLNVLKKTAFGGLEIYYLNPLLKILHFLVFGRACKFFLGA